MEAILLKLRVDCLTSWRFIAGFHLVVFHEAIRQHWVLPSLLQNVVDAAFMQVTYFFLVSGFVFGIHYLRKVEEGRLNVRDFLFGRLSRLYPTYLVGLMLSAPFFWRDLRVHHEAEASRLFAEQASAKLTMTQGWFPGIATEWNPPSWAMSAVLLFYLLFPFLGGYVVRLDGRGATRLALSAFAISLGLSLGYCFLAPNGWQGNAFEGQTAWTVFMRLNPLVRLPEFLVGLCLARACILGVFERISVKTARRMIVLGLGALVAMMVASSAIPYMLLHHTLPVLPYVLLLVGFTRAEMAGGLAWLRKPTLVSLGNASFSMYILHVPVSLVISFLCLKALGMDMGWLVAVLNVGLAVVVALVGQRLLEGPTRNWMNRALRVGATA